MVQNIAVLDLKSSWPFTDTEHTDTSQECRTTCDENGWCYSYCERSVGRCRSVRVSPRNKCLRDLDPLLPAEAEGRLPAAWAISQLRILGPSSWTDNQEEEERRQHCSLDVRPMYSYEMVGPSNLLPSGYQARFPRGQSSVEFYVNKADHSLAQGIEVKNGATLHIPYTLMVGTGTVFVCFTFQWLNQLSVIFCRRCLIRAAN